MRIVLLGAPGSGKGTQAARLSEYYGISLISSVSVLKEATNQESPAGLQARAFQDHNQHVPDEILLLALRDRFLRPDIHNGFLMVGYPRTAAQADALDGLLEELNLPLDLVLRLEGDPDNFMERLEGRRICQSCGATYNVFTTPPIVEGICDRCGGWVKRRADDNEETIASRMRIYEHQSVSLIRYYMLHGKLRQIDGNQGDNDVFTALCRIIDEHPPTIIETEPVTEAAVPITLPPAAEEKQPVAPTISQDIQKVTSAGESLIEPQAPAPASEKEAPASSSETKGERAVKRKTRKKGSARTTKKIPAKKVSPEAKATKKTTAQKPAAKKSAGKKAVAKKVATKKVVAKKSAPRKTVVKKSPTKKSPVTKAAAKKTSATGKTISKKTAPGKRKPAKTMAKKPAAKKPVSKRVVAKKAAAKKGLAKKTLPRKTVTKKGTSKSATVTKRVLKKSVVKKTAAKTGVTKKAPPKKRAAKKSVTKAIPAKKRLPKKGVAKKVVHRMTVTKKVVTKKATAKKGVARPAKKPSAKKRSTKKASVKPKKVRRG